MKLWLQKCLFVLMQTAVPLLVVPQCISRGKQCFWRQGWRPHCTLLSLFMWTPVSLRWSRTPSHCQATSSSLSMGQYFLLTTKSNTHLWIVQHKKLTTKGHYMAQGQSKDYNLRKNWLNGYSEAMFVMLQHLSDWVGRVASCLKLVIYCMESFQ